MEPYYIFIPILLGLLYKTVQWIKKKYQSRTKKTKVKKLPISMDSGGTTQVMTKLPKKGPATCASHMPK